MPPFLPLLLAATTFAATAQTAPDRMAPYAKVSAVDLVQLGFGFDPALPSTLSLSGDVVAAKIDGSQLRYLTPSDRGSRHAAQIQVSQGGKTIRVPLTLESEQIIEPIDIGPVAKQTFPLHLAGLGPGNSLMPSEFRLSVGSGLKIDASGAKLTLYSPSTHAVADITGRFTPTKDSKGLVASAEQARDLMESLAPGLYKATVSLPVKGEGRLYEFTLLRPAAQIAGVVLDGQGKPAENLHDYRVAIRRFEGVIAQLVDVDAAGKYSAQDLIPGLYDVRLLGPDLVQKAAASASIKPTQREISVDLRMQN